MSVNLEQLAFMKLNEKISDRAHMLIIKKILSSIRFFFHSDRARMLTGVLLESEG